MLVGPITTPACTGADGSGAATVTSDLKVCGFVYAVYVQYTGDDPGTTDVTVATQGTSPNAPATTILSKANSATDGWFQPRVDSHLASTGATQSTNDQLIAIEDYVVVTVAQANTGDIISVWLMVL